MSACSSRGGRGRGPDGDVERRDGLVGDDQLRLRARARAMQMRWRWPPENSWGSRRGGPAPGRPGRGVRRPARAGRGRARCRGSRAARRWLADAHARIERGVGVLEDELDVARPALGARRGARVTRPRSDLARGGRCPGAPAGGLAGARFADEPQGLAGASRSETPSTAFTRRSARRGSRRGRGTRPRSRTSQRRAAPSARPPVGRPRRAPRRGTAASRPRV